MTNKIIKNLIKDFKATNKIVEEENKKAKEDIKKLDELYSKNDMDSISNILVNSRVENMFKNRFNQMLFTKILYFVELSKLQGEDLDEEVKEFYDNNKGFMPNPVFAVEEGEMVEAEEGFLEKKKKEFLEGDEFKRMKSLLEQQSELFKK